MKEILQNKLLIAFLIFFVVVGTICSYVGAYTSIDIDDTTYSIGSNYQNYDYILIVRHDTYDTSVLVLVSNSPIVYDEDENGSIYTLPEDCYIVLNGSYDDLSTYLNNGMYTLSQSGISSGINNSGSFIDYPKENILFSSYDVRNSEGELVFQGAPLVVSQVELMKAIQPEEIPQQIAEIVVMILPIFLLIFGTLLVLYLLKSKNLLHL